MLAYEEVQPLNPRLPQSSPAQVFCYSVVAAAEPGVLPRVLGAFAKRGLVPLRWVSQVTGQRDPELSIDIQIAGPSRDVAQLIARCLDQLYEVKVVLMSEKAG